MRYVTNGGPTLGALLHRDVIGSIDVLDSLEPRSPVGMAFCTGANAAGVAVWRLSIRGRQVPGTHVVLHRLFRPA